VPVTPQEILLLRRCVRCNDELREITREDVFGRVPDYVLATHSCFYRCPKCLKIYWRGSHPERMIRSLERELGWALGGDSSFWNEEVG